MSQSVVQANLNRVIDTQRIFDSYCHYVLAQSNAAQGRYDKDDLREYVLHLPHAIITMVARDMMVEELPIISVDVGCEVWVTQHVFGPMERGQPWAPTPFLAPARKLAYMDKWDEWSQLDKLYMPHGLEPVLVSVGDDYIQGDEHHHIGEIRFLPLKSYEYRKAQEADAE
jgi:hypothetical protein